MPEDIHALMSASPDMLLRYANLHAKAATILRALASATRAQDSEVVAACLTELSNLASAQTRGEGANVTPSA